MKVTLDIWAGISARDEGIETAVAHAEAVVPGWSDAAYAFLVGFVRMQGTKALFMAEDVRKAAEASGMETPPSQRAWGGVFQRAAKEGLIKRRGYAQVKNPTAHCANATVWVRG